MTDKSKNTDRSGEGENRQSRRDLIIWLIVVLSVAALIVIGIVWGLSSLLPVWFEKNPRMALRRVEVTSKDPMYDKGYWNGHKAELIRRLGLNEGGSVWQSDSGELRRKLEDPKLFSSVQSARVYKDLPDTLRIEITERTPVAFIHGMKQVVVDETCMLIKRSESMVAGKEWNGALPTISVVKPKNAPGTMDKRFAPAVALIMEVQNKAGADIKMRIIDIDLRRPNKMICRFRIGGSGAEYRAVFPTRHYEKKLALQLLALKTALIQLREEGRDPRDFDLSFDGQVVVRGMSGAGDNGAPAKDNDNHQNKNRKR